MTSPQRPPLPVLRDKTPNLRLTHLHAGAQARNQQALVMSGLGVPELDRYVSRGTSNKSSQWRAPGAFL